MILFLRLIHSELSADENKEEAANERRSILNTTVVVMALAISASQVMAKAKKSFGHGEKTKDDGSEKKYCRRSGWNLHRYKATTNGCYVTFDTPQDSTHIFLIFFS